MLGVFRVSDLEVNTQDYGLPRRHDNPEFDNVTRFPFALHPIAVWEVTSSVNMFAELVGPLPPKVGYGRRNKLRRYGRKSNGNAKRQRPENRHPRAIRRSARPSCRSYLSLASSRN